MTKIALEVAHQVDDDGNDRCGRKDCCDQIDIDVPFSRHAEANVEGGKDTPSGSRTTAENGAVVVEKGARNRVRYRPTAHGWSAST